FFRGILTDACEIFLAIPIEDPFRASLVLDDLVLDDPEARLFHRPFGVAPRLGMARIRHRFGDLESLLAAIGRKSFSRPARLFDHLGSIEGTKALLLESRMDGHEERLRRAHAGRLTAGPKRLTSSSLHCPLFIGMTCHDWRTMSLFQHGVWPRPGGRGCSCLRRYRHRRSCRPPWW